MLSKLSSVSKYSELYEPFLESLESPNSSSPSDIIDNSELLKLWSQPMRLFRLANLMRQKSCGDEVSFVINRNINFTDRCLGAAASVPSGKMSAISSL
jgi:2-iminoacetate synthase ThiH